ncbi:MAG: pro-sigmaK processing inhibitor BofA family protein, partial [Clostridia bacterium]
VLAKFTDKSAYVLCCFIKGAALILISNWALELLGLGSVSLNLFTAPIAGILGVPAVVFFLLISIFF